MSADALIFGALAAFAIVRFLVEPDLTSSLRGSAQEGSPSAAEIATLAAARFLGTFFLYAALGAGMAQALTIWVESIDVVALGGEATPPALDTVSNLLGLFHNIHGTLAKIGLLTAVAPTALLGVGLLYWSIRSARGVEKAIWREVDRLRRNEGLEDLPSDERMQEVEERIRVAHENHEDTAALYDLKYELDLLRRVHPSLLRRAGLKAPLQPLWLRGMGFMVSGTVYTGKSRVATASAGLATVLLIPASLLFASQGLSDAVAQTTQRLEEVRRNIVLLIAERDASTALESMPVNVVRSDADSTVTPAPPDAEPAEVSVQGWCDTVFRGDLSASDCKTAAKFGRALEVEWASRFHARGASNAQLPEPALSTEAAEEMARARREWTRERVLTANVRARTTASVDVVKAAAGDDGRWERVVLDAELTSRTESRPVTPIGRNAEIRLREFLRVRPGSITVSIVDAPLSSRELVGRAASGAISAFVDISKIEERLPGTGGRPLWGALAAAASEFAEETVIRASDAEFLAKASDVAAKSAIIEASRTGRITPETMNVIGDFVDDGTARRIHEPLGQATELRFENLASARQIPAVALGTRPDPHIDRFAVNAILRESVSAERPLETGALSSYDGIFPALKGQEAQTQHAEMLRTVSPELAERRFGPPPEVEAREFPSVPQNSRFPDNRRSSRRSEDTRSTRHPDGHAPASGPMELTIWTSPSETPAQAKVDRARSYSQLRGFARVGGVLIGRDPEPETAVAKIDLTEFRFFISDPPDSALRIELEHSDGTAVTLGPYDPAIVHFALAYAADGRPTTVTMITAEPLHDLKILLHPALVDTGLGCRAIRLDQFVDEFGLSDSSVADRRERAYHEHHGLIALVRRAWADRFFTVTAALEPELGFDRLERAHQRKVSEYDRIVDSLNRLHSENTPTQRSTTPRLQQLQRAIEDLERRAERSLIFSSLVEELRPMAEAVETTELPPFTAVAWAALRANPDRTLRPLRDRPEYFDGRLLDVLDRCAATIPETSSPADVSACIRTVVNAPSELQKYGHSRHFSWLAPPPQIVTWSGVREQPYEIDREFNFARVPLASGDEPLRFVVQNAMVGPPLFAVPDRPWYSLGKDESSFVSEIGPWELDELENDLHDSIQEGVSGDSEAHSVLEDFHQFTALQRLFRAAFAGRLGLGFPAEKLGVLATATALHINQDEIRTPRWNPRPLALELEIMEQFNAILERGVDEWETSRVDNFREIIEPCQTLLPFFSYGATSDRSSCELEAKVRQFHGSSPPRWQDGGESGGDGRVDWATGVCLSSSEGSGRFRGLETLNRPASFVPDAVVGYVLPLQVQIEHGQWHDEPGVALLRIGAVPGVLCSPDSERYGGRSPSPGSRNQNCGDPYGRPLQADVGANGGFSIVGIGRDDRTSFARYSEYG